MGGGNAVEPVRRPVGQCHLHAHLSHGPGRALDEDGLPSRLARAGRGYSRLVRAGRGYRRLSSSGTSAAGPVRV